MHFKTMDKREVDDTLVWGKAYDAKRDGISYLWESIFSQALTTAVPIRVMYLYVRN